MPGQLNLTNPGISLVLAPPVPMGVRLGIGPQGRFGNEQSHRIGLTCVFVIGGELLFDALRHLHMI